MKQWNNETDGFFFDKDDHGNVALISVYYNDNTFDISASEPRFSSVHKLITEKNFNDLPKYLSNEEVFKEIEKNEHFEYKNGVLYIKGEPLPSMLGSHILEYYHGGHDYLNLINFWDSLKSNTDNQTKQDLYTFLKNDGMIILPDGSFIAYRTVNGDFKDIWTKTVDNSIGTVVSMPKEKVDANVRNMAGSGLHIATIKKAINFGGWRKGSNSIRLLAVKVFPKDVIVGIDIQSDQAYMRACKYEVLSEIKDGLPLNMTEALRKKRK